MRLVVAAVAIAAVAAFARWVRFPAGEHAFTRWNGVRAHGRLRLLRLPLRIEPGTAPLRLDGAAYLGSLTLLARLEVVNTHSRSRATCAGSCRRDALPVEP